MHLQTRTGGTIIIGVEDKTRHIFGVNNPLSLEERLANLIDDTIYPKVIPNIEIIPWRNTYIVSVEIYPSPLRPHYLKKAGLEGVYVRIGSTNRRADQSLIEELRRYTKVESYDEQLKPELSSEEVDFRAASEQFIDIKKLKALDLKTMHLIANYQGHEVPTVGGVILFGKNREKHFPDAWIQAGRFEGNTRKVIIDSKEIHSYPTLAVFEAIQFIQMHLSRGIDLSGIKRKDLWSVPLVVLREAIINAIVHMDYSQKGAPIRVSIFDNRIEIENPGLIPFNLTIDELKQGISKLRNRVIGRVFHELKLIERWGSGIPRIIETCNESGLPNPLFEEIGTHFKVTIFTIKEKEPVIDRIDQAILDLLLNAKGLSTKQIADNVGLSTRAIRTRLISLIERGIIFEIGSSSRDPNKKYFLKSPF